MFGHLSLIAIINHNAAVLFELLWQGLISVDITKKSFQKITSDFKKSFQKLFALKKIWAPPHFILNPVKEKRKLNLGLEKGFGPKNFTMECLDVVLQP
jgi:hypothetical protein